MTDGAIEQEVSIDTDDNIKGKTKSKDVQDDKTQQLVSSTADTTPDRQSIPADIDVEGVTTERLSFFLFRAYQVSICR